MGYADEVDEPNMELHEADMLGMREAEALRKRDLQADPLRAGEVVKHYSLNYYKKSDTVSLTLHTGEDMHVIKGKDKVVIVLAQLRDIYLKEAFNTLLSIENVSEGSLEIYECPF